jgi:hypothetical protein
MYVAYSQEKQSLIWSNHEPFVGCRKQNTWHAMILYQRVEPRPQYWRLCRGDTRNTHVKIQYYTDGSFYQPLEDIPGYHMVKELLSPLTVEKNTLRKSISSKRKHSQVPIVNIVFYNGNARPNGSGCKLLTKLESKKECELTIVLIKDGYNGATNSYQFHTHDFLYVPYQGGQLPSISRLLLIAAVLDARPIEDLCKEDALMVPDNIDLVEKEYIDVPHRSATGDDATFMR